MGVVIIQVASIVPEVVNIWVTDLHMNQAHNQRPRIHLLQKNASFFSVSTLQLSHFKVPNLVLQSFKQCIHDHNIYSI
jgi:hypothetical protein